jgi:hypothetical protein
MTRCRDLFSGGVGRRDWVLQSLCRYITKFTLLRAEAGDKAALAEYGTWIRSVTPEQTETDTEDVFEPLWRYPENPEITQAAEWLFNSPDSPWNPVIDTARKRVNYYTMRVFRTPLFKVAAFRKQLLRKVTDRSEAGAITVRPSGRIDVKVTNGWSTGASARNGGGPVPPAGTTAPFRMCDLYANLLKRAAKDAPRCELFWPEEKRDKAVAACADFLKGYGKAP